MDFKKILREEASKIGVRLDDDMLSMFETYKNMMQVHNRNVNITSLDTDEEILYKHFIDSLTVVRHIGSVTARCIDIGTGAGFPLMPVKIAMPGIEAVFVDSVRKKTDFLAGLICKLGIGKAECIHARAEDLARESGHRGTYDLSLSRAVAPIRVLVEYSIPFLKTGGIMIALKGDAEREVFEAGNALKELGAKHLDSCRMKIAYNGEINTRTIVSIIKAAPTDIKYPRKAGIVKRLPL